MLDYEKEVVYRNCGKFSNSLSIESCKNCENKLGLFDDNEDDVLV